MPESIIPYAKQSLDSVDRDAVLKVLEGDWLTQGPTSPAFAAAVAEYCDASHAIPVANGTMALHISALAAGIGPGKCLWTSPISFVASANCALYCGADIDFVDIDKTTGNMSMPALKSKLERAEKNGGLPDVIVPVHLAGSPCDLDELAILKEKYGFMIIEDAAHALGASYHGNAIGGHSIADMTIFSFHPVKSITTCEGGMVLTPNKALARKLELLANHGITRNPDEMLSRSDEPWYYEEISLGYNYRLSDLHAALGLSQLKKLDTFISKRRQLKIRYDELLAELPLKLLKSLPTTESAHHLYVVRFENGQRNDIYKGLRQRGIGSQVHYIPIYRQPIFKRLGFSEDTYPEAESYYQEALSLPLYPDLTNQDQDRVVAALTEML